MRLLWIAVAAVAACSSPKPPAAPQAGPQPPAHKAAAHLVELKIPPAQATVTLMSDGTGQKQLLRYTARPGAKQTVEVAMDFTGRQDTEEAVAPTIVLFCDARTGAVDKDGAADYTLTVTATDARAVAGAMRSPDELRPALGALAGLTIAGKRGANGAAGEVTIGLDHPADRAGDALGLIREAFPSLPVLPTQPVGVGARWQATSAARVADKLDVTQVTDYEVVAHDGPSWTIKGTTRVSGKDQKIDNATISAITGAGTSETTIADGAPYPSHKVSLETQFTASDPEAAEPGKSVQFTIKVGGSVTPR